MPVTPMRIAVVTSAGTVPNRHGMVDILQTPVMATGKSTTRIARIRVRDDTANRMRFRGRIAAARPSRIVMTPITVSASRVP